MYFNSVKRTKQSHVNAIAVYTCIYRMDFYVPLGSVKSKTNLFQFTMA